MYQKGKYQEAITAYETELSAKKQSAELYFNIGNCYYKLNKVAPSIYNYEKALLLNPSDAIKVFQAVQPKISGFDQQKIQDAIDVGKKYGIQWVADAVNDLRTGAARGAVQGVQQEEQPVPAE